LWRPSYFFFHDCRPVLGPSGKSKVIRGAILAIGGGRRRQHQSPSIQPPPRQAMFLLPCRPLFSVRQAYGILPEFRWTKPNSGRQRSAQHGDFAAILLLPVAGGSFLPTGLRVAKVRPRGRCILALIGSQVEAPLGQTEEPVNWNSRASGNSLWRSSFWMVL